MLGRLPHVAKVSGLILDRIGCPLPSRDGPVGAGLLPGSAPGTVSPWPADRDTSGAPHFGPSEPEFEPKTAVTRPCESMATSCG